MLMPSLRLSQKLSTLSIASAAVWAAAGIPASVSEAGVNLRASSAASWADEVAIDPAAKALIDKSRLKSFEVKDISASVVTMNSQSTPGAESLNEAVIGDFAVTIDRSGRMGRLKFFKLFVKSVTGAGEFTHSFDGTTAYKLDLAGRTLLTHPVTEEQVLPVVKAASLVPSWIMGDVLMQPLAKLVSAKMLPDAEVAIIPCKVVQYTVEVPQPSEDAKDRFMVVTQTRHIAEIDMLPRKIDSTMSFRGTWDEPTPTRRFAAEYSGLRFNQNPVAADFKPTLPEGFASAKGKAEDLGVLDTSAPTLKFKAGDAAPSFTLKDAQGKDVSLESLKGKVVLLDFWATWCGPCKAAMPGVQKLHAKYQGKPVAVLGVNTWERGGAKLALDYMTKNNYTYGTLLKGDDLAKAYGFGGIPAFVLIGPDGKIISVNVGFSESGEAKLAAEIEAALPK